MLPRNLTVVNRSTHSYSLKFTTENRLGNTGAGSDGSPGQGTRRPEATVFTQHHTSVLKGKADKVTRKFLKFSPEDPREWTLPKSKRTEPLQ